MIRYALTCSLEHGFEAWFGASADYDDQAARGLVECPFCGSREIRKQIMAPAVAGTKRTALRDSVQQDGPSVTTPSLTTQANFREVLGKVRRHVEDNFDYVGDTFAREARAIHEGASEDRPIYGEATPVEARALVEDGIKIAPLPPKPPAPEELN